MHWLKHQTNLHSSVKEFWTVRLLLELCTWPRRGEEGNIPKSTSFPVLSGDTTISVFSALQCKIQCDSYQCHFSCAVGDGVILVGPNFKTQQNLTPTGKYFLFPWQWTPARSMTTHKKFIQINGWGKQRSYVMVDRLPPKEDHSAQLLKYPHFFGIGNVHRNLISSSCVRPFHRCFW